MADTTTTKHGFVKPEVNASDDTWGAKLNTDLDQIDALINIEATTTEVLTGTAADKEVTPDALAALWELGASVAAATTVTLAEGGVFVITGSGANITDIDFAVAKDGRQAFIQFAAANTLVNSATLQLQGGANIATAAGDWFLVIQTGGDQVNLIDLRLINTAISDAITAGLATKQPLDAGLTALAALTPAGIVAQTAADTYATRTIAGAGLAAVTNGDGVAGAPTVTVTGATAANMEAVASGVVVTPNIQNRHPSAAKVWGRIAGSGTPAIHASYNMTSLTDNGVGDTQCVFGTDFTNDKYGLSTTAIGTTPRFASCATAPGANYLRILCYNDSGNLVDASDGYGWTCFGDQV
jgi:hypothetical protein